MKRAALESLAGFLERFSHPRFRAGEWVFPKSDELGVMTMPYVHLDGAASNFVAAAYENGWVEREFDWVGWSGTSEAGRLRDDPRALATAEPRELSWLLTTCIRQDRFVEGALLAAFESGLILRIVQRAAALLGEETEDGGRSAAGTS